jgi:2-hydroxyglutaryl-CoA dehydratase, D-component
MSGALETLRWHYEHRSAEALAQHRAGVPVVGYTSNTVPWELLRAAGCFPVLVSPDRHAPGSLRSLASNLMEPVFDARIRRIFEEVLSGAWSFLKLLVIPRTSEPEYKLYLYLREVEREKLSAAIPPVWLYDLLHTRSPLSRSYGLDRTKDLIERLKAIPSRRLRTVSQAVAQSNRARAALIKLKRLRSGAAPLVGGTEALAISGAFYFMDRAAFAPLVETVCREARMAKKLHGPRLLIKGTPLDHPKLHQALEAQGAVVIAEDDWWGLRAAEKQIPRARTTTRATGLIFENYYRHAPSPRVSPAGAADEWFEKAVRRGVDAVVFYLPPDDDVYGWDYPRQRDFLQLNRIPSLLIREEASAGLSSEAIATIRSFLESLPRRRHARARS